MTVKNPKCLVIDTSVMLAAGGENAFHPVPVMCRNFLQEVMKSGHSIIMTDELLIEWNRYHLTTKSFIPKSPAWYATMERKGKVRRISGKTERQELREAIFQAIEKQAIEAVRKDMRLIEAALLADEIVASKDDKMRGHFRRAAVQVEKLQAIVWVNPTTQEENCIIWLREGALTDAERTLGYKQD
ncbi:MAG: hypothetical protein K8L97_06980 [Anaerolineae bacterium]|nr:hypothetical protein [Anaerolineae bacterium]